MASPYPTQKVTAVGIAGSVSILIVWGLHQFMQVNVPPEVASACTTLLAFLAGYLTPHSRRRDPGSGGPARIGTHTDQSTKAS